MKVNDERVVLQANKIFTDREEPRKVFWDIYDEFKKNIDKVNDIKVITYYGIGGIGKTSLLKQLRKELKEKIKKSQYIYFDFDNVRDTRAVLKNMRNKLQSEYDFEFPMFDLAIYIYLKKIGEDIEKSELKSLTEKSPIISSLMDICGVIPVIGFVPLVLKGIDNLVAATRNNINNRRSELYELQSEEPDDILKNLPYYFAGDLRNNLKSSKEPFVVFFDTYEALVNELMGIGEPLKNDEWIRNEKRGLITNIPNVIWVIAGREKIKWEQFNNEWEEALNQHLLGDLSETDADSFLQNAGIYDEKLRKDIYVLTNGTPIYLDISVDRYYSIIGNNETPSIKMIGTRIEDLIERFVRYMDDNKKDLMYLLSCLDEWTDDLLFEIAGKILSQFSYTAIEKIKGYSFISTEDGTNFVMHQTVKDILYKVCPNNICQKANSYMELYLHNELEQLSSSSTRYLKLLKRYLNYKFRNISNSEEFNQFYKDIYIKHYNKLKESYQYNELCNVQEFVAKYSSHTFGKSIVTSECYMDYFTSLDMAGKYKKALQAAEISFNSYKEILGEEHIDTIKAIYSLSKIYYRLGNYNESIKLSEKALELDKKVLGKEHPDTIRDMNILSADYDAAGRIKEALELSETVLELRTRILGVGHPDTITAMNNLSSIYSKAGRNQEGLELSEKASELLKAVLGEEHPDTITAMNNLSNRYSEAGRKKEALELSENVLELRKRILGEEHPVTITSMNNLSNRYSDIGRIKEALELSEKVLELRKRILGEEHADTIKAMNNLSNRYSEAGRKREALELSENVLELRKRILGEEHPDTVKAMKNLSIIYNKAGKNQEALELSEKLSELSKRYCEKSIQK